MGVDGNGPKVKDFVFGLRGPDGTEYPNQLTVRTIDIDHALKQSRRYTTKFQLPGWRLVCDGVSYPIVKFKDEKGKVKRL